MPHAGSDHTPHDAASDGRGGLQARRERAKRSRLRMLITTAVARQNDVLIITEVDGPNEPIVYVNSAIARHSGYSPEEVLDKTPRIFQGPGTSRVTLDRLSSFLPSSS